MQMPGEKALGTPAAFSKAKPPALRQPPTAMTAKKELVLHAYKKTILAGDKFVSIVRWICNMHRCTAAALTLSLSRMGRSEAEPCSNRIFET